jgi:hypothetical protein
MAPKLPVAFALGVMAAEHVHGISRKGNQALTDAIFKTLQQVANGDLTLVNAPEETIAGFPAPMAELAANAPEMIKQLQERLAAQVPEMTRQAMRDQRQVAAELLEAMR